MYNIFIIEDDYNLCKLIKDELEKYDYNVNYAKEFRNLIIYIEKNQPDLLLLDINLPYYDGFYICRNIRKKSKIPIIFVSSRDTTAEQVMGIELGADDFITKPFTMDLMLAKVKAVIRRVYGDYADVKNKKEEKLEFYLDKDVMTFNFKDRSIDVTKNEFKLMYKLCENIDKIVSREELLGALWDDGLFVDDNTLTVNVTRVKNKLKDIGIFNAIKTKRGLGYILDSKKLCGEEYE